MTPKEVAGLQSLARANGGSLTVNPSTGLPEAGFLSAILPMIAGAAATLLTGGAAAPIVSALAGAGAGAVTKGATSGDWSAGSLLGGALSGFGGAGVGSALGTAGGVGAAGAGTGAVEGLGAGPLGAGLVETTAPVVEQSLGAMGTGLVNSFSSVPGLESLAGNIGMMPAGAALAGGAQAMQPKPYEYDPKNEAPTKYKRTKYNPGEINTTDPDKPYFIGQGFGPYEEYTMAEGGEVKDEKPMAAPAAVSATQSSGPLADYLSSLNRQLVSPVSWSQERQGMPKPTATTTEPSTNPSVNPYNEYLSNFRGTGLFGGAINEALSRAGYGGGVMGGMGTPQYRYDGATGKFVNSRDTSVTNPATTNPATTNPATTNPATTNPAVDYSMYPGLRDYMRNNNIGQQPDVTPTTNPATTNPATTNPAVDYSMYPGLRDYMRNNNIGQQPDVTSTTTPTTPATTPEYTLPMSYEEPPPVNIYSPYNPYPTSTEESYSPPSRSRAEGRMVQRASGGGIGSLNTSSLGGYSDGGRLLRGPGDGVSDDIPATIHRNDGSKQEARLADGEFVIDAQTVSRLGNGSTEAGAKKLYAMMGRIHTIKTKPGKDLHADKYLPA